MIRRRCKCGCGRITNYGKKYILGHNAKGHGTFKSGKDHPFYKHGLRRNNPKAFYRWWEMLRRCYKSNRKDYRYYGARGIRVCIRWKVSCKAFVKDMGEPPTEEHTIDRIDNNGNYTPDNCRWATKLQQSRNKGLYGSTVAYMPHVDIRTFLNKKGRQ